LNALVHGGHGGTLLNVDYVSFGGYAGFSVDVTPSGGGTLVAMDAEGGIRLVS
jgi:hypothetical protein